MKRFGGNYADVFSFREDGEKLKSTRKASMQKQEEAYTHFFLWEVGVSKNVANRM